MRAAIGCIALVMLLLAGGRAAAEDAGSSPLSPAQQFEALKRLCAQPGLSDSEAATLGCDSLTEEPEDLRAEIAARVDNVCRDLGTAARSLGCGAQEMQVRDGYGFRCREVIAVCGCNDARCDAPGSYRQAPAAAGMTEAEFRRRLGMSRFNPQVRDALTALQAAERDWLRAKQDYERFLDSDRKWKLAILVKDKIKEGLKYGQEIYTAITTGVGAYALFLHLGKEYALDQGQDAAFYEIPEAGIPDAQERYEVFAEQARNAWNQYLEAIRQIDPPLAEFMSPSATGFSRYAVDPFAGTSGIRMPPPQ